MTRSMTLYALACRLNGKSPPRAALREILAGGRRDSIALYILAVGSGVPAKFGDGNRYAKIELIEPCVVKIFARPVNGKAPLEEGGEAKELSVYDLHHYDAGSEVEWWYAFVDWWEYSLDPRVAMSMLGWNISALRIYSRPENGKAPIEEGGEAKELYRYLIYHYHPDGDNEVEWWYWGGDEWVFCQGSAPSEPEPEPEPEPETEQEADHEINT